jgi:DNA-binding transcriptional MerR regulator
MNPVELQRYARISYRQLDFWVQRGLLKTTDGRKSPGSGNPRVFSDQEAKKARVMRCLLDLGFKLETAHRIARLNVSTGEKRLHLGHGVTILIEPHTHPGET